MYSRTRVLDRLPGGEDAERRQRGGEQHEQHRDAVDAHVVADAEFRQPGQLLLELEAGGGVVELHPEDQADSRKTIRLVQSAVQRALLATTVVRRRGPT